MAAVALAALIPACPSPKPVAVIREPTNLPPQAKVVTTTCAKHLYLRGGRHLWRNNRWQWEDPRCTPKPASWRDGCAWIRGRWRRQGDRIAFLRGRIRCPGDADPRLSPPPQPAARPTHLPPAPPSGRIGCGPGQYLQVGRYVWRDGAWRWRSGRCAPRPAHWKAGCRWERGRWSKASGGLVFTRGRLVCP